MKFWIWPILLFAVAVALGADEVPISKSIFSILKVGQQVKLTSEGSGYSISFFADGTPLTHKVVEIQDGYIVVEDVAGVSETTVPIYAVKGIVKMRLTIAKP